ncbi:hypothetical protein [Streptomyces coffeae]|uniref:hypothetical protein n=1 Tax=Streptomyces coffeae TaxID=621382 RepID=UPI001F3A6ED6|nr:hypothetical protein [Streptomyces coffeae]
MGGGHGGWFPGHGRRAPPWQAADAEYKPLQLRVAAEAGLRVPRTLITNDPKAAHDFADVTGGPIVHIDWRSDYDSHTYKICEPPPYVAAGALRYRELVL